MTGITDPTEEYFKDGLWGWVTSAWKKLAATTDGILRVQVENTNLVETPHVLLDGSINSDTLAGAVVSGDLIAGNATPKWARLAAGANGARLEMVAGVPTWVPPVVARCNTAAGQSISNGVTTVVDFGTVLEDTHNAVTVGAAWKFTAPVAGLYEINTCIVFANTTTWADAEEGSLAIKLNGVLNSFLDRKDNYGSASNIYMQLSGSKALRLAAGDYINISIFQISGAALALFNNADFNNIEIFRVCA